MLQYKKQFIFNILIYLGLIYFIPSVSHAADYSPGDPCSSAGAFHQTNDTNGMDFLICDGSNWQSTLYFGSAGGLTISTLSGQPAPQYSSGSSLTLLDQLNDVDTTGKSTNDVLTWDGSSWGAAAPSGGGGGTPAGADRQIQFNSGGAFTADANFVLTSTGTLGVGTSSPYSDAMMQIYQDYAAAAWKVGLDINLNMSGNAGASYNGVAGITTTVTNSETGTNSRDAIAFIGKAINADDGSAQGAYAFIGELKTFAGDTGYGLQIRDDDTSTGGTQYGVYINLNDTDVTRWGIYQTSANKNYLAGNVGIGDSNPSVALSVVGDINYTGVITDISDRRLKENITPLTNSLEGVLALQGYSFTMKGDATGAIEYGLIAQEVQAVFPHLVVTKPDGTMALNYMGLFGPLVEAVKEQQKEIEAQQNELGDLRARLEALEARYGTGANISHEQQEQQSGQ